MNAVELLLAQFERVHAYFLAALQDLSAEQLRWQPQRELNSIGFLLWHVLRTWDDYHAQLAGHALYEAEGWSARFGFDVTGRGVGGSGMGTGFTPDDVAVVQPNADALTAYLDALWAHTQLFLGSETDDSLARETRIPWWTAATTPARVLSHIIAHSLQHLGEAQFVRGLLARSAAAGEEA